MPRVDDERLAAMADPDSPIGGRGVSKGQQAAAELVQWRAAGAQFTTWLRNVACHCHLPSYVCTRCLVLAELDVLLHGETSSSPTPAAADAAPSPVPMDVNCTVTLSNATPGDVVLSFTPHGMLARGEIHATLFEHLSAYAIARGWDDLDIGLCHALQGHVWTNEAGGVAWGAQVEAALAHLPPLERWAYGLNTGTSSLVLACVLGGIPWSWPRYHQGPPTDPSAFGKCLHVLSLIPGGRERLGEVVDLFPEWYRVVEAWDELTELAQEEGFPLRLALRLRELCPKPPTEEQLLKQIEAIMDAEEDR